MSLLLYLHLILLLLSLELLAVEREGRTQLLAEKVIIAIIIIIGIDITLMMSNLWEKNEEEEANLPLLEAQSVVFVGIKRPA